MQKTRRMMMAGKGLPSEYQRLEYISNPNKGYIDTGFIPNQDTRITCKIKTPKNVSSVFCFGSSSTWVSNAFEFWGAENLSRSQMSYDGQGVYKTPTSLDAVYTLDFNKNVWNYGNVSYTFSYKDFTCPYNLYIWHTKRYGNNIYGNVDYYGDFKIYDNDSLVRDFIPAKRKSDGTIGMYDLVGRKFYTSPNGVAFSGGVNHRAKIVSLFEPVAERRAA